MQRASGALFGQMNKQSVSLYMKSSRSLAVGPTWASEHAVQLPPQALATSITPALEVCLLSYKPVCGAHVVVARQAG